MDKHMRPKLSPHLRDVGSRFAPHAHHFLLFFARSLSYKCTTKVPTRPDLDSTSYACGGSVMTFEEILDQAIAMLQRRGRLTYSTLKRQFQLDDAALEDLKNELIEGQRLAVDEQANVLVWTGAELSAPHATAPPTSTQDHA